MELQEFLEVFKDAIEIIAFFVGAIYLMFRLTNGGLNASLDIKVSAIREVNTNRILLKLEVANTSNWVLYFRTVRAILSHSSSQEKKEVEFQKMPVAPLDKDYEKAYTQNFAILTPSMRSQYAQIIYVGEEDYDLVTIGIDTEKGHRIRAKGYYVASAQIETQHNQKDEKSEKS